MTVKEAIYRARDMSSCDIQEDMLLDWLNDIEARVQQDVLGSSASGLVTYSTVDDTVLLLSTPWAELYVIYLLAQIYFYRQEAAKYANMKASFDEMFDDYSAWYQRTRTDYGKARWIVT